MDFISDIKSFLEKRNYPKFEPKAALVDMDGLLYDSMPLHARAWHKMASQHGLESTVNEFFGYEGMTGRAIINFLFNRTNKVNPTADEVRALYEEKSKYFAEQGMPPLMKDADKMMEILKEHHLKRALVTGSGQRSLIERIAIDYPGAFEPHMYITATDVAHGKPDAEPYLRAMRLTGTKPWESIVIENAPCGVTSGARAGAFTIGVATGPIPLEDLRNAGAAVAFESMTQFVEALLDLLDQLSKVTLN